MIALEPDLLKPIGRHDIINISCNSKRERMVQHHTQVQYIYYKFHIRHLNQKILVKHITYNQINTIEHRQVGAYYYLDVEMANHNKCQLYQCNET